jgi:hypothetical protein
MLSHTRARLDRQTTARYKSMTAAMLPVIEPMKQVLGAK